MTSRPGAVRINSRRSFLVGVHLFGTEDGPQSTVYNYIVAPTPLELMVGDSLGGGGELVLRAQRKRGGTCLQGCGGKLRHVPHGEGLSLSSNECLALVSTPKRVVCFGCSWCVCLVSHI